MKLPRVYYQELITHCQKGHPYSQANTYYTPLNKRICRLCRYASTRKYIAKHGKARRWYSHYNYAKWRCCNKKAGNYPKYGGRGIQCLLKPSEVKMLWERDRAWLLKRPSIDRIDPDGHYEVRNCRFIELSENSRRGGEGKKS